MNRTAADIARAYAKFATQATGELLRLGAEAAGASAACLYWRVREQVIAVPVGSETSPQQIPLSRQIRRDFWPWLQAQPSAARERVLVMARSDGSPGAVPGQNVILLTLQDYTGELGGIIALQVSATQCADILGPWRDEAIGFADLVRQNLLADLDQDTGLLTPASFDAEMQRWRDSVGERHARACLLNLHLDHLDGIAQALGADIHLLALQDVLGLIETRLRSRDVVARLGPACVGVLLKQCDQTDARRVCAALEDRLRDYRFRSGSRRFAAQLRVTVRVLDPQATDGGGFDMLADPGATVDALQVSDITAEPVDPIVDPPLHSATVLAFPDRTSEAPSTAPDRPHDDLNTLPLRAQPCRLLASPERILLYRLRGMIPDQVVRPADGLSIPAARTVTSVAERHAAESVARRQCAQILDQIAQMTAARPMRAPDARTASLLLAVDARLVDDGIVAWLTDACRLRQVPHSLLCLSVAEVAIIADVRRLLPVLGRLQRAGFGLCVETGRGGIESPALIRRLRFDYLHAAMTLSRRATIEPGQARLLVDQVTVAVAQGARLICGGVDTAAQLRQLADLGVHIGHGRELGASISLTRLRTGI